MNDLRLGNITLKQGDIFESKMQTLVNPVNCVGVMGKGLALEFKKRFHAIAWWHKYCCSAGYLTPGRPVLYQSEQTPPILLFPTKNHWRDQSNLDDILNGLDYFILNYQKWGIKSAAFPALGCGNGGLSWRIMQTCMVERLSRVNIPIEIYKPPTNYKR